MDIDKDYFTTTYDIVEKHIDSIDILILSHLWHSQPGLFAYKTTLSIKRSSLDR